MKLTIDGQEYDFDPDSLTNKDAAAIEKATGSTFNAWIDALNSGSITALTALVWTIQKRTNPALRIDDVEFRLADVAPEEETDEVPLPDATGSASDTSESLPSS